MRLLVVALLLALGWGEAAAASPCTAKGNIWIGNGYLTGATLNELSERDLGMYVAGYVDALQAGMIIGVQEECYRKIRWCSENRTNTQFAAMVKKYLRENPANWHQMGGLIVYNAMFGECLK